MPEDESLGSAVVGDVDGDYIEADVVFGEVAGHFDSFHFINDIYLRTRVSKRKKSTKIYLHSSKLTSQDCTSPLVVDLFHRVFNQGLFMNKTGNVSLLQGQLVGPSVLGKNPDSLLPNVTKTFKPSLSRGRVDCCSRK